MLTLKKDMQKPIQEAGRQRSFGAKTDIFPEQLADIIAEQ
jgi:hypothetical protein